jgi:CRISPR/Cas system CSM-associated protein Csm3 (group 7 of RAMP superfamily)
MNRRGSGGARDVEPKPYDFVPFPTQIVQRSMPHGQETALGGSNTYSGILSLELEALTPIFVAAGRYALSEELGFAPGEAARGCYRLNGRPALPGASVKGMVRAVAEAVSPSHVTLTRMDVRSELVETGACRAGERACPVCALFGTGGTRAHIGLVRFEDALPVAGTQTIRLRLMPLFAPRASGRGAPQAYMEQGELKGRKFYFHSRPVRGQNGDECEVIPPGTRFTTRLSFLNSDEPLLGVLFFALALDGSFQPKLGGGKPLGLGSLAVAATDLRLLTREALLGGQNAEQRGGDMLAGFIAQAMRAAQAERLLLGPQVKKLREILKWPPNRQAITGVY